VQTQPLEPLSGGGRRRWALPAAITIAAIAIAAIVVAIVVLVGGGGSSEPELSGLVLPPTAAPGDLIYTAGESGDLDPGKVGLPDATQAAFHNVFTAKNDRTKPYWYSESSAAVFEDEKAAQAALAGLEAVYRDPAALGGKNVDDISAKGLGDEGFAVFGTGVGRPEGRAGSWEGSEYLYAWRTGNHLQVFELDLSGPGVSEHTARGFAETMASRSAS
jgi:hypothetical protein